MITATKRPSTASPPTQSDGGNDSAANLATLSKELYDGFRGADGNTTAESIKSHIQAAGIIYPHDPRLTEVFEALDAKDQTTPLSQEEVLEAMRGNLTLSHQIASCEMAIADFPDFRDQINTIYNNVEPDHSGANAGYIPILRDADPEKFAVAFCSIDGQFYEVGDSRVSYSIQSTSKPLTFAQALQKLPTEEVLSWCGIEPSGRPFNDMTLLPDNRPFNPMVNAGALMTAATLTSAYPEIAARDGPTGTDETYGQELCEQILMPLWTRLSGNDIVGEIGFSEETFLSERRTADNNIGIAYCMKAKKGLPPKVATQSMIDFYLRACSITANTASMSVVAATLANGGRNPITGDQVFRTDVVKKTLSVLSFCGFYDNAGEFFFHTGIPSKSGVSGVVFLVLPEVGGFAIFSPRLDKYGNSVRASEFAKKVVETYTFHSFDSLTSNSNNCKLDPRFSCDNSRQRNLRRKRWALKSGGRQQKKFDELLVNVCLRVAMVDGSADEREIEKLCTTYQAVMHQPLSRDRLQARLKDLGKLNEEQALDELHKLVSSHEMFLDDLEKQMILEMSIQVTTADGIVDDKERRILKTLSSALRVTPLVVEMKLNSWMKQKNSQK